MSDKTPIEWCDSTLNLQMGCDGCELWTHKIRKCYAGRMTAGRAGFKGWPARFDEPVLFPERLEPALKWKNLTGTPRPDKPWLNDLPRIIFLNDMGDTFSKSLPEDWLAPMLPKIAESPHQFLLLTKRPSKLLEFSQRHPLPPNVWPGTTITSAKTAGRAVHLREIETKAPTFLSVEPIWGEIPAATFEGFEWVIFGGESAKEGEEATATDLQWIMKGIVDARAAGAKVFVKQLGSRPIMAFEERTVTIELEDLHGGNMEEWPAELRIREMPKVAAAIQTSLL